MKDSFGREINYLRWSVTDRCNLRCTYCMPQEKMVFSPRQELLSIEEMQQLLGMFYQLGIRKIRFTGGEPLMRKGINQLFEKCNAFPDLKWHITTNGIFVRQHLESLITNGISGINLSLDTLDQSKFLSLTRRDLLLPTLETINEIQKNNIS
ncbi:MAG: radical SAM protein, partial [Bacteroidota bacterium]